MNQMTDYAKTSDNFLANRFFKQKIFTRIEKGDSLRVAAIYLDCFEHFAISQKFINELLQTYVDAGLMDFSKDKKEVIRIE